MKKILTVVCVLILLTVWIKSRHYTKTKALSLLTHQEESFNSLLKYGDEYTNLNYISIHGDVLTKENQNLTNIACPISLLKTIDCVAVVFDKPQVRFLLKSASRQAIIFVGTNKPNIKMQQLKEQWFFQENY